MKQQPLPGVDPADHEALVGLTPWVLASEQLPPVPGWYKTRRKDAPNVKQPQRRYWSAGFFSLPVSPDDNDDDAEWLRRKPTLLTNDQIEWCGLRAPAPESDS